MVHSNIVANDMMVYIMLPRAFMQWREASTWFKGCVHGGGRDRARPPHISDRHACSGVSAVDAGRTLCRAGYGEDGCSRLPLFCSAKTGEVVSIEFWRAGAAREFSPDALDGLELFVVSGKCLSHLHLHNRGR